MKYIPNTKLNRKWTALEHCKQTGWYSNLLFISCKASSSDQNEFGDNDKIYLRLSYFLDVREKTHNSVEFSNNETQLNIKTLTTQRYTSNAHMKYVRLNSIYSKSSFAEKYGSVFERETTHDRITLWQNNGLASLKYCVVCVCVTID